MQCPAPGTVISATRGSDFDEVTHYYVSTGHGYIRVNKVGGVRGTPVFSPEGAEVPAETVHNGYSSGAIIQAAPQPGGKLSLPIALIGLPDGTKLISPTGKSAVKSGLGIEQDGQHFDVQHVDPSYRLAESATRDRLRALIAPVLSDTKLAAGARLSESGYRKVAARLGIPATEVAALLETMATEIRMQRLYEAALNEDGPRFSYEKDFLGNVTVRDNQTGKACFLRGSEAAAVINRLAAGGDEQQILSAYAKLMEGKKKKAPVLDEDDSFHHEIHAAHGAYNFPWKAGTQSGFATARFKGRGPEMKITVLSVRDGEGEPIELDEALEQAVHDQAVAFIGDE